MSYNMASLYPADPRQALQQLMAERGASYAALSRMLGRARAYLQQYVTRGSPAELDPRDRRLLADHFGVDEAVLGGLTAKQRAPSVVQVPRLSVQASAGPGAVVEDEFSIGAYRFDAAWLRDLCQARPEDLSIIRVSGDSMAPALADGDDVLVDCSTGARLRDGMYVLRRDDTLMVKRLALAPTSRTLTVSSDNPAYPTWRDVPVDSVVILGRVVWIGRKLG